MARAGDRARPSRDLDRDLVHLRRRMAGVLVDAHDRLLRRTGREAEDLAGLRVEPGVLVVDALLGLDVEVALVGLGQLLRRSRRRTRRGHP